MLLDRRKQQLLHTIVVNYVARAEPVGSAFLASDETLGVRSATIRNELSEMTDWGYLLQPHTSAGRIPSDRGYRYYVDHLMSWVRLPQSEARAVRSAVRLSAGNVEQLLAQTCRVLSSLTRYTSLATPPNSEEPAIRQVHLAQVSPVHVLAVVVLQGGRVNHSLVELSSPIEPHEVTKISNFLDGRLRGLNAGSYPVELAIPDELQRHRDAVADVAAAIARRLQDDGAGFMLQGTSRMLDQPEFKDSNRIEPLIRFLEERRDAYQALRRILGSEPLTVSIGEENPAASLRDVSFVAARYCAGPRLFGWVGVLGPTRMAYQHALPAVEYAARVLSESLTRLSVD